MAAALVAKEGDFRLIAEQGSDVVMRVGLDERIIYASPSCTRMLGWDPARLLGTSALDGVNPEDRPRVEQVVAALKAGEAEEARIIYRANHRQKKEIWVETALRVTRSSETHEIDGVVAISRDMTEQKDLQDKLAALATSDGLTGIANRRHFDERLTEEWARAKRDGTPLSLLLVDVDHFKKFNDQYGHQAGDACLRALARILAAQVRRPADLAARYGGEEFALLLPNTDAEGCELVGENVRRALRDLGMLHALNLPSKIVTVSLGGATKLPSQGAMDCGSLVAAADRALYAAKNSGPTGSSCPDRWSGGPAPRAPEPAFGHLESAIERMAARSVTGPCLRWPPPRALRNLPKRNSCSAVRLNSAEEFDGQDAGACYPAYGARRVEPRGSAGASCGGLPVGSAVSA